MLFFSLITIVLLSTLQGEGDKWRRTCTTLGAPQSRWGPRASGINQLPTDVQSPSLKIARGAPDYLPLLPSISQPAAFPCSASTSTSTPPSKPTATPELLHPGIISELFVSYESTALLQFPVSGISLGTCFSRARKSVWGSGDC